MTRFRLEDLPAGMRAQARAQMGVKLPVIPKGSNMVEPSRLETMFAQQIAALGLPEPVQQYVGAVPGRKYRIDFCWVEPRICLEIQGMAHRIKGRFLADCEKVSLLTLNNWRVLLASGDDVRSGRAAAWATSLLVDS